MRSAKHAGLGAARDARRLLANLLEAVGDDEPALAADVSSTVGLLFGAEVGDEAKVLAALRGSLDRLQALLEEPRYAAKDEIAQALSRACAVLHPVTHAPGAGEAGEKKESTAPFLLASGRIKSAEPAPGEDERRITDRMELLTQVGLEGDNRFYTGKTGDLSRGGLFIATDDPLPVGTRIILSFVLPDQYRVSAEACVAWVRAPRYRPHELPAGMGVRFERLGDEAREAVEQFLIERPAFYYGG